MNTNKNRNIAGNAIIFFIIVYATMFLFGFVENIKGVTFPLIKTEFGVQYDSQGGLVSITWMGYVASCLVASLFMQRFGIKKSVLTGYILVFIGAIATMGAPSFWTATLTLLLINTGFGFFEIGTHRGIETITYLIHGDIEHGDSLGNSGSILDGECQWMTAGILDRFTGKEKNE